MSKRSKGIILGGASSCVLLFLSFGHFFTVFVISTEEQQIWAKAKTFSLEWNHSVEKEAWIEEYVVQQHDFLLTKTRFKTFGAGVPSTQADSKDVTLEDGFVVMTINQSYPSLQLVVSSNVKSTLHINGHAFPLYEWAGDYETVTLNVQHWSFWDILSKGEFL